MGTDPHKGPESASRGTRSGEDPDHARFRPKPPAPGGERTGPDAGPGAEGPVAAGTQPPPRRTEQAAPGNAAGVRMDGSSGDRAGLEEARWREDHWPFAAPPPMPVLTPPPQGGSTYPRAVPAPPGALLYSGAASAPSWNQSRPGDVVPTISPAAFPHWAGGEPSWGTWDGRPLLSQPLYGATFTQALRRFVAKQSRFAGFASPSEFWWVVLAQSFTWVTIVICGALLYDPSMGSQPGIDRNEAAASVFSLLAFALMVVTLVPNLSLLTRRLHDAGLPGALGFMALIPGVGWLCLFVCTMLPSRNPTERNPAWEDLRGD